MSNLYIMHYGVGHDKGGHSGRYPWGSGKQPYGETHGKPAKTNKSKNHTNNGAHPQVRKILSTTSKDLITLNGRPMYDVTSDLITQAKRDRGMYSDDVELIIDRERTNAFLKNIELLIGGAAASTALGFGGTVGLRAYFTYKDFRNAHKFASAYNNVVVSNIK